MKKSIILVIIFILSLTLASISLAQPGSSGEGAGGPGTGLYDPKTVETISGLVVSITAAPPQGSLPQRVLLTLKTDRETIPVFLGPSSYIDQQGVKIAALDQVQVRGSRIMKQGRPTLIAAEVKKGGQVLKLRDESGVPLWSGQKRPSQALPESRKVYPQGQGLYWPGRTDNR